MNRYLDARAILLVEVAANSLPHRPDKAKAILSAILADSSVTSSVDLLGIDLHEFMENKAKEREESDSPQEKAEDKMEDLGVPELESISTQEETPEGRPLPAIEANKAEVADGGGQKRNAGEQGRALLLEVAGAARKKGKIGLAERLECGAASIISHNVGKVIGAHFLCHGILGDIQRREADSCITNVIRLVGSITVTGGKEDGVMGLLGQINNVLDTLNLANQLEASLYVNLRSLQDVYSGVGQT